MNDFLAAEDTLEQLVEANPINPHRAFDGVGGCLQMLYVPAIIGGGLAYFADSTAANIVGGVVLAGTAAIGVSLLRDALRSSRRSLHEKVSDGFVYFHEYGFTAEPTKYEQKNGKRVIPVSSAQQIRDNNTFSSEILLFNGLSVDDVSLDVWESKAYESGVPNEFWHDVVYKTSFDGLDLELNGRTLSPYHGEGAAELDSHLFCLGQHKGDGVINLSYVAPALSSPKQKLELYDLTV